MDRSEKTRLDDLEILAAHQSQMLDDINEQYLLGVGLHLSGADLETNIVPRSLAGPLLVRHL